MALYTATAGSTISAADVNQYNNLFTGVMTDQTVTLSYSTTGGASTQMGLKIFRANPTTNTEGIGFLTGLGTDILIWRKANNDSLFISQWNGTSSADNATFDTGGNLTMRGGVSATTGTFSSSLSAQAISGTSGTFSTTLGVTGAATLSSTLTVAGTATFNGAFVNTVHRPAFTNQDVFVGTATSTNNYWGITVNGSNYYVHLYT